MEQKNYISFLKKAEELYSNKVQSKFKLDDKSYHSFIKEKSSSLNLDNFKIVKDHTLEEFFTKYRKYLGKNIIILDSDELWLMNPKKEYWEIKNDSKSLYFEVPTKALMFMNPYGCIVSALLLAACIGVGGYYLVKSLIPVPPVYEEEYDPDTPEYADHIRVFNYDLDNLAIEGINQCEQFVTGKKIEFTLKLASGVTGCVLPNKDEIIFDGVDTSKVNYTSTSTGCNIWFVAPDNNINVVAAAVESNAHTFSYNLDGLNAEGSKSGSHIKAGQKVSINLKVSNVNTSVIPSTTNTMKINGIDSTKILYDATSETSANLSFIMPDEDVSLDIKALSKLYSEFEFDISKAVNNPATVILNYVDEDPTSFDIDWGVPNDGTIANGEATSPALNANTTIKVYGNGVKSISICYDNNFSAKYYSDDNAGIVSAIFSPSIERIENFSYASSNVETMEMLGQVTYIGNYAFNKSKLSCNLYIPDSIVTIGFFSFEGCYQLKGSLNFINDFKHLTYIGQYAFGSTNPTSKMKLTGDLVLPDNCEIGDYAFQCSAITSVLVPSTTPKIQVQTFAYCSELLSVSYNHKCGPNNISRLSMMFAYCPKIESLYIGKNVDYFGEDMFSYSLQEIVVNIPNNVILNGGFPIFGYSNVIKIVSSAKIVYSAYMHCSKLIEVDFLEGTEELKTAVQDCDNLKKIVVDCPSKIKKISSLCKNCPAIDSIIFNGMLSDDVDFSASTLAPSCTVNELIVGRKEINSYILNSSCNLNHLILLDGVELIKSTGSDLSNLKSIGFPNTLISIDSSFSSCTQLNELIFPNSLKEIKSSFCGCTQLQSITLSSSIIEISGSFQSCSNLTEVDMTSYSLTSVLPEIPSGSFENCSASLQFKVRTGMKQKFIDSGNVASYITDAMIEVNV